MTTLIDRIIIAVPDLMAAQSEYQQLLDVDALHTTERDGERRACFVLPNTVLELRQQVVDRAALCGLVFSNPDADPVDVQLSNPFNLALEICDGQQTKEYRSNHTARSHLSVDHVVLRTVDADACVAFFGEHLGIRLALDKTVPQWGGRMLFFRTGKLTLEVIEVDKDKPEKDYFWGIALQCNNLEKAINELVDQGVALSKVRTGRKAGTLVASVKSHCLGIPTLLIEPVKT
ncbi:MAG: catechol 2,3-dioxygenase-like lactoylglutathione lyase family enzyme [Halioglobus sp.]|jgi:catechol 2,3-dioxygenase-like lactoylglutathione lyase family enzyme